jgi:Flp pilus assembly protein TadD
MAIEGISGSNLFALTIQSPAGLESLANGALTKGIDLYMNGNYKEAAKEFQRSMGLARRNPFQTGKSLFFVGTV